MPRRKMEAAELQAMVDVMGDQTFRQLQHDNLTDMSKTRELKTWGPKQGAVPADVEVYKDQDYQEGLELILPRQVGRTACADASVHEIAS